MGLLWLNWRQNRGTRTWTRWGSKPYVTHCGAFWAILVTSKPLNMRQIASFPSQMGKLRHHSLLTMEDTGDMGMRVGDVSPRHCSLSSQPQLSHLQPSSPCLPHSQHGFLHSCVCPWWRKAPANTPSTTMHLWWGIPSGPQGSGSHFVCAPHCCGFLSWQSLRAAILLLIY